MKSLAILIPFSWNMALLIDRDLFYMLQRDVDGKAYYTFEFTAQAPNFTRHALGTITIGNGMFSYVKFKVYLVVILKVFFYGYNHLQGRSVISFVSI